MTEGMTDAAEKAKNRYDELLNTINNYDSAIEKIKGLETGTHEFTSALLEANKQAQFLIDKYNLLADTDYYVDENGIVRINQGKQNQLIRTEEENVESATAMLNTSNILQNKAQQEIDASNLGSDFYEGDHLGRDLLQDDYERLITLIEEQYGSLINFQENVSKN